MENERQSSRVPYEALKLNYMQSPQSRRHTWHECHPLMPLCLPFPMHNAYGILRATSGTQFSPSKPRENTRSRGNLTIPTTFPWAGSFRYWGWAAAAAAAAPLRVLQERLETSNRSVSIDQFDKHGNSQSILLLIILLNSIQD